MVQKNKNHNSIQSVNFEIYSISKYPELVIENINSSSSFCSMPVGYSPLRKILDIEKLDEGWHFGDGIPIKKEIIEKALIIDEKAFNCGYYETDAIPGINGEIEVTIYYLDDYFEFIIEKNEEVTYVHEYNNNEIAYEENISFSNALKKIEKLKEELCSLSEYSIQDIGSTKKSDIVNWLSEIPVEVESQLYVENAFYKTEEQYVSI